MLGRQDRLSITGYRSPSWPNNFDQAKDQVLASLSSIPPLYSAHFEACDTGDELLQCIQALPRLKNKSDGVRASTRIIKHLQFYIQFIESLVQVDKLHTSTLVTNYTAFTDKFVSSLYTSSAEFPIFDRFSWLFTHTRLISSLDFMTVRDKKAAMCSTIAQDLYMGFRKYLSPEEFAHQLR
ncbi:hypothetical protein TASIC1_0017015000 [Trichoderma asperellum]|uniref:Uncharacterized protein n=1 Tax=Trichoderma asperellum TaxID=101201 RepID=A0A6V8RBK3_TRIAP|nr:hypothetical protein TASIC1_0017015000 [Trichoderma asperellum]